MVSLSFKEKKDLAIKLIEQGVPIREIRKAIEGDASEKGEKTPIHIISGI